MQTIWKTKVLRKDKTPEMIPLFKAVKNAEAKMEKPEMKYEIE